MEWNGTDDGVGVPWVFISEFLEKSGGVDKFLIMLIGKHFPFEQMVMPLTPH